MVLPFCLRASVQLVCTRLVADEAVRAAHNLKSLAASFDAHPAMHAAAAVEKVLPGGDLDGARSELQTLKGQIDRLAAALAKLQSPAIARSGCAPKKTLGLGKRRCAKKTSEVSETSEV